MDGKWGLILGGTSGIGLACAKKLLSHGMNLVVVHRSFRKAENQFIEEIGNDSLISDPSSPGVNDQRTNKPYLYSINADATQTEKRKDLLKVVQQILSTHSAKIFLYLHGIAKGNLKSIIGQQALQDQDYTQTFQSMGSSFALWANELLVGKCFDEPARIVALTSEGSQRPLPQYAAVGAAKATLEVLVRQLAVELAPFQITTNCLQPGVTDTTSLNAIPHADKIKQIAIQRNPFERLSQPEDTANALYLLCRKEAAWINGCIIPVDGGEHLR